MAALASSKPGVKGRGRDYELEAAKAEVARRSEAVRELAVKQPVSVELGVPHRLAAVQSATPRLQTLRAAGVAITLDDMRSGSSSLRHISRLAVDGIKIDGSFMTGIADNERDLAVARMLIDLGAGLGLMVTAEGVDQVLADLAGQRPADCSAPH